MILHRQAIKLLTLMSKNHEKRYTYAELTNRFPKYNISEIMKHLESNKLISGTFSDGVWQYTITSSGRALLENSQGDRWKEFRAWVTLLIAVAAFMKSFFY